MPRCISLIALWTLLFLFNTTGYSQTVPVESPRATLEQQLGFTNLKIEYGRPNVKGRKIWGGLVPYNTVWRTGANLPTFITLTDTTYVEEKHKLLPGKYALYTIPKPDKWTIIFSRDVTLWGAFGYAPDSDALRVEVTPRPAEFTESFSITAADLSPDKLTVCLQWERLKVPIRLNVHIHDRVIAGLKRSLADKVNAENIWAFYWTGANYLMTANYRPDLAMQWVDSSLKHNENWMNQWVKAKLLAQSGQWKPAVEMGNKALENGKGDEYFPYQESFTAEIKTWEEKLKKKHKS